MGFTLLEEECECHRGIKMATAYLTKYLNKHEDGEADTLWRRIGHSAPVDRHHDEGCADQLGHEDEKFVLEPARYFHCFQVVF